MFELMQNLVAFKYACKINHWSTDSYAKHLLFDRLQEGIDDAVDDIAEKYFMSGGDKKVFNAELLNSKMVDKDPIKMINALIKRLEKIQSDTSIDEGMRSVLSAIEADFLTKLALVKLS